MNKCSKQMAERIAIAVVTAQDVDSVPEDATIKQYIREVTDVFWNDGRVRRTVCDRYAVVTIDTYGGEGEGEYAGFTVAIFDFDDIAEFERQRQRNNTLQKNPEAYAQFLNEKACHMLGFHLMYYSYDGLAIDDFDGAVTRSASTEVILSFDDDE